MPSRTYGYLGKPNSVVAITTNYTIPVGYFAVVSASARDTGTVSIDGTIVMRAPEKQVPVKVNQNIGASSSYTIPANARFKGVYDNGTGAATFDGLSESLFDMTNLNLGPGCVVGQSGASNGTLVGVLIYDNQPQGSSDWHNIVPAGTVIAVSGSAAAMAALYPAV